MMMGVNAEHFQRPVAGKAHIAKSGSYMHHQPQTANRRTAFQHGDKARGFGIFLSAAQIQAVWTLAAGLLGEW